MNVIYGFGVYGWDERRICEMYYTYPGLEYDGLNVCMVMNVDIRSYHL